MPRSFRFVVGAFAATFSCAAAESAHRGDVPPLEFVGYIAMETRIWFRLRETERDASRWVEPGGSGLIVVHDYDLSRGTVSVRYRDGSYTLSLRPARIAASPANATAATENSPVVINPGEHERVYGEMALRRAVLQARLDAERTAATHP